MQKKYWGKNYKHKIITISPTKKAKSSLNSNAWSNLMTLFLPKLNVHAKYANILNPNKHLHLFMTSKFKTNLIFIFTFYLTISQRDKFYVLTLRLKFPFLAFSRMVHFEFSLTILTIPWGSQSSWRLYRKFLTLWRSVSRMTEKFNNLFTKKIPSQS